VMLFVGLAVVMTFTRHIDWYALLGRLRGPAASGSVAPVAPDLRG